MFQLKKNIKRIKFLIEKRTPYIPNFLDPWVILKIVLISILILILYSFAVINRTSEFPTVFLTNLELFLPYLLIQLFLLILSSKIIKILKPINAVLYLIFLNFISVYFTYGITNTFDNIFSDLDTSLTKFGLSYGMLFFYLIYFDWREKNLHPSQLQAQLSFLQSKMRPHFLFNTLNSIASLIKKEPDIAKKMLLNLSELLRVSLKEENTYMHSLDKEINLCQKYLEIEKIRLGDRLEIVWDIQKSVEKVLIPKLSIQPLIENSILHGIQHLENGGKIEISIRKSLLSRLIVEIKNSKPTEPIKLKEKSNKISIKNIIERLNICFNGDVSFTTKNYGDVFYVSFEIPIIVNKE